MKLWARVWCLVFLTHGVKAEKKKLWDVNGYQSVQIEYGACHGLKTRVRYMLSIQPCVVM